MPADPLVAVIAGGDTDEYESSLSSGHNVVNSLSSRFACVLLELHGGEWSVLRDESRGLLGTQPSLSQPLWFLDRATGRRVRPDVAVLCTHGFPGETGELQGLLSIAGVPYCSSGVFASALAADKFRCSEYLRSTCGTKIPRQQRLTSAQLVAASKDAIDWPPPYVLKPTSLGSALGILSVHDRQGISAGFEQAAAWKCDYVIQEFIEGVEITAGAVRFRDRQMLLPTAGVLRGDSPDGVGIRRFTDHQSVRLQIPAEIPAEVTSRIHHELARIGEALGLVGFYRADFIWSGGDLYFLEVNTIPGLGERSVFTRLANAAGLRLGGLLETLIAESVRPST